MLIGSSWIFRQENMVYSKLFWKFSKNHEISHKGLIGGMYVFAGEQEDFGEFEV